MVPGYVARGTGTIVNIALIAATAPDVLNRVYGGSKAFVLAFSRSLHHEFVRDTESDLLFNHSSRIYCFAALAGRDRGLTFDAELLYTGAMFHDVGLMPGHSSALERSGVDGASAAKAFLENHGAAQADVDTVWAAIALHTTPGVPQHMHPVIALVTAGVEMDVLGLAYGDYADDIREAVVSAYPCTGRYKMVPVLFLADRTWAMSALFEVGLAIPVFLLAALAMLPFAKRGVIGFAWAVGVTRNPTANP